MPESFKTTLVSYIETPGLTPLDRAHLREWSDDDVQMSCGKRLIVPSRSMDYCFPQ
jgi:hypothetical protein